MIYRLIDGFLIFRFNKNYVASFEQVAEMAEADDEKHGVLLDVRPPVMFGPEVPEGMENMKGP